MVTVLTWYRVSDKIENTRLIIEKQCLFNSNFEKNHSPAFIFPKTEICLPKAIMKETNVESIA